MMYIYTTIGTAIGLYVIKKSDHYVDSELETGIIHLVYLVFWATIWPVLLVALFLGRWLND